MAFARRGRTEGLSVAASGRTVGQLLTADSRPFAAGTLHQAMTTEFSPTGQPVLYLDFDGVLHPEDVYRHPRRGIFIGPKGAGHTLFQHAGLLQELLQPYPDVGIVLSTSWVRVLSFSQARRRLPSALSERVVGATYHSSMDVVVFAAMERGHQVLADVGRRRPGRWVALDDDGEGWPESVRARLVLTDPLDGLAAPAVLQRAVEVFGREFGEGATAP